MTIQKTLITLSLILFTNIALYSQEDSITITYYDKAGRIVEEDENPDWYEQIQANERLVEVDFFDYAEERKLRTISYLDYNLTVREGMTYTWFPNGKLASMIEYHDNKMTGTVSIFWADGKPMLEQTASPNGKVMRRLYYDESGKSLDLLSSENTGVKITESPASFFQWVALNIDYPVFCRTNEIKGKLKVNCFVDDKGKIIFACVQKGLHRLLDTEAERVFTAYPNKMQPATNGEGLPIFSWLSLPIAFNLNN